MYCKNPTVYGAVILLVCLLLVISAEAQLNFSTGWGKRNKNLQTESGDTLCPSQGRPSLERLLSLYNLIQIEAHRILHCRKSP